MQTHYIKNKLIENERFSSELDSLIYQNIPFDYLIPEEMLLEKIYKDILKEFSYNKYLFKEISVSLNNMIQKQQVKELYGTKLSKYISIQ